MERKRDALEATRLSAWMIFGSHNSLVRYIGQSLTADARKQSAEKRCKGTFQQHESISSRRMALESTLSCGLIAGTLHRSTQLQASGDRLTQVGWTPEVRGAGDVQKLGYMP